VLTGVDNSTDGATGLPVIAANDSLTILGNGDTIERSTATGTPAFRLFDVAGGAALVLENLTLENGLAQGPGVSAEGGAIYNQGGLGLNGVTVQNNFAQGAPGQAAAGGGIYSSGTASLSSVTLSSNSAQGGQGTQGVAGVASRSPYVPGGAGGPGGPGGNGLGGAVCVAGGSLTLTNDTVFANTAWGGNGGGGGAGGYGGASSRLAGTGGRGGNGGAGGNGLGGAVYVAGGTVTLTNDTVYSNTAWGGSGGQGGPGGNAQSNYYGRAGTPGAGGYGGAGGNGFGGAVYVAGGTATLTGDTVYSNTAWGGNGGKGGINGAIYYGPSGSPGSSGMGEGGGLYIAPLGTVYLDAFTLGHFSHNTASTSNDDVFGSYTLV
jgi:hypothetical protein